MFEKATAEEKKYLEEYKDLTARESLDKDRALERVKELEGQLATKPVERKAAPPPPPLPAAAPLPPKPASAQAFYRLPLHEQKALRAAYANIEDELDERLNSDLAIQSRRGDGATSHRIVKLGDVAFPARHNEASYVSGPGGVDPGWHAGAPKPIPPEAPAVASPRLVPGTLAFAQAACDSLNQGLAAGQVRRSPAAKSSVPFIPTSAPPAPKGGKFVRLRQ